MAKKIPNPIDTHVGSRVRMRRLILSMSQEKLADAIGLTFQQVQKYEKGTNRMGSSRLVQIANVLKVPVTFFLRARPVNPSWMAKRSHRSLYPISSPRPMDSRSQKHSCKSRTPSYGERIARVAT